MRSYLIILFFLKCTFLFSQNLKAFSGYYFHSYGDKCDIFVDKGWGESQEVPRAIYIIEPSLSKILSSYLISNSKLNRVIMDFIIIESKDNSANLVIKHIKYEYKNKSSKTVNNLKELQSINNLLKKVKCTQIYGKYPIKFNFFTVFFIE